MTGREIFDSRGIPTIECIIELDDGSQVSASVPSGTSRGTHEARELRDGGTRLNGNGVLNAVDNINRQIQPLLIGREPHIIQADTSMIQLDDTDDKSNLGANAILAVSAAVLRAQAKAEGFEVYELIAYICGEQAVTIPSPMFNVMSGGAHADNHLSIQEIMIIPFGMATFRLALEAGMMLFRVLREHVAKSKRVFGISDEGALIIDFRDEIEALDLLSEVIASVEGTHEGSFMIALDVAATQFYTPRLQQYHWQNSRISAADLVDHYGKLIQSYPIYSIEDGLGEDDWIGWQHMYKTLGSKVQLVGDDLFTTDPQRIWQGIEKQVANAVLIKPNQIGTITETLQAIRLCQERDMRHILSHRSGETNDSLIADIAVGTSATQIKAGACMHGERMAKYNRLLSIEDELLSDDN